MAHHVEPMDVDSMDSDFDNKENTYHHSNVLPCTEKGYEELDVSELNMKLRYSMTPASSPMSKSYTASLDCRNLETGDSLNCSNENTNLTRSLNSTMVLNDSVVKSLKNLPLQSLPTEQFIDGNGNASVLRQLDSHVIGDTNIAVTVSRTNDIDENLSLPSTSSSPLPTPEATTPTKEISKNGGSPILRGLKSVLNMFRSSQSPIVPGENENITEKQEGLSPVDVSIRDDAKPQAVSSTPIAAHRDKDGNTSKRSSPYKDSIVFNDDLEKELNWKDETSIIFSHEKIPVHKLFFQNSKSILDNNPTEIYIDAPNTNLEDKFNSTVECMDVSYNESLKNDETLAKQLDSKYEISVVESDSEFVDCETTFSKNESIVIESKETGGKALLTATNAQNLDVPKHMSFTNDNAPATDTPFLSDVTGLSFTEEEHKNNVTENSDYSDYSKETNEILSELEKFEKKITSTVEETNEKNKALENITEKKEAVEQQAEPLAIITNVIFENDKQERKIESTYSQDNQFNETGVDKQVKNTPIEEQTGNMTQPIDHETLKAPETDSTITYFQDTSNQDNGNESQVLCDVTKDLNNLSQDIIQIIPNQDNVNESQVLFDVTLGLDSQTIKADQRTLETTFAQDLNNTESQSTQITQLGTDISIIIPTNSGKDTLTSKIFNATQEEIKPNLLDIWVTQKSADIPDEECPKEALETVISETLNVTQNIIEQPKTSVFQIENPSDIPLPDEDDIDTEIITGEIKATSPEETAPVMPPEMLDETKTLPELDTTEIVHKDLVEDKIGNNLIKTNLLNSTSQSVVLQGDEVLETTNTVLKSEITKTLYEKSLESLTQSVIGNDILLPKHCTITSIEIGPHLPSELPKLTTNDSKSEVIETKENIPKTVSEGKTDHLVPEHVTSSNNMSTNNETCEHVLNDRSEIDNDLQCVTNLLNASVAKDNFERACKKIQDIEPMDITMNESLNQTHNLPDLLKQTDVVSNETVEDKIGNDLIVSKVLHSASPQSVVVQVDGVLETANTEITKTLDEKPLESLTEDTIGNEILLPEHCNIASIEMEPLLSAELPKLPTNDSKSDVIESVENFPKTVPESNNGHQLPEHVTSSNTITKDNFEQPCNKIQDIEPMDITMNESLNQTHDIPYLMNQTDVVTDENAQIVISTDTIEISNGKELAVNSEKAEIVEVEIPLKIIAVDTEVKNNDVTDSKINRESVYLVETTQQSNKSIDDISQGITINLPTTNENMCDFALENIPAVVNKPEVKSSDDQPTETIIGNTANVENMEVQVTTVEEEIILSENNSPYVSLMAGAETVPQKIEEAFEEIQNPFVTNANVPSSPPITSRGYNFNFDEMDDPFATKTKTSLSSPLDTIAPNEPENEKTKPFEAPKRGIANRRKSQPVERKKTAVMKKKFNITFDEKSAYELSSQKNNAMMKDLKDKPSTKEPTKSLDTTQILQEKHNKSESKKDKHGVSEEEEENTVKKSEISLENSDENKSSMDSISYMSNDIKTTSSSEQSIYYTAGTSSTDSFKSKNVFNLPEIDDVNFNPFVSKSKMCQSPTSDLEVENPFATRTKIRSSPDTSVIVSSQINPNSTVIIDESKLEQVVQIIDAEDKMETELMEKDTSSSMNNTTSSKAMDHLNLTTREVNTEDEDTIEGPFLEVDDVRDKLTDFDADNVDNMMQFNDVPVQAVEDNPEEELFIDAEAYEFLLNQNSNVVADSGKESLFLKFDPLFAKRISSVGVLEAMSKVQKRQSTPTKPARPSLRNEISPIAGPSINITYEGDTNVSQESNDDVNITVSKPMMVVTPAVNPAVTPRSKSITPARSNRHSVTFTSPAIAVIDRLLSMTANNSFMGQDTTITHTNTELTEADLALAQLRELLAEKEIIIYDLRSESKELKDRLSTMESQVRNIEADGQVRLKKINELNERLAEKTKINKSMAAVVEEYERTIASLIAETEQDKKRNAEERIRLINERDEQTVHLTSMEVSFNDLHSKYEKSKQVIFTCKANEDTYRKSIKNFEENLAKMQTNYEMLKQHATSKLNFANQELEKLNRAHESEVVKLHAMIKRKDLHVTSLEETLTQKTKANEELTAICDELINKVG